MRTRAVLADWFKQHAKQGWATTPFTQAAFVRIVSQQVFAGRAMAVAEVAAIVRSPTHGF